MLEHKSARNREAICDTHLQDSNPVSMNLKQKEGYGEGTGNVGDQEK
jgi:hypothetical protein